MMNTNQQVIEEFYSGFAAGNAKTMESCYHKDIQFQDPAFGILKGNDVIDMWEMLIEKSEGNLKIEFSDVEADDLTGSANWVAEYHFGKNNRKVVNYIRSSFEFKDGLIIRHVDHFNIWNWAKQALGLSGYVLGWTGFMQQKIQQRAIHSLRMFQKRKAAADKKV